MFSVHAHELMDALESLSGIALSKQAWRVVWKTRGVLNTGGGGRWNHPGRPDVLYCSCEANGAIAEVYHHLSRAPVFSTADKLIYALDVRTENTLVLDSPDVLGEIGLSPETFFNGHDRTRDVTHAAFLLDFDSMLVPSLRWNCMNLIVFDHFVNDDQITIREFSEINWPAWRETYSDEYSRIRRQGVDILQSLKSLHEGQDT